jgi:uncharacterized OB-fold protein
MRGWQQILAGAGLRPLRALYWNEGLDDMIANSVEYMGMQLGIDASDTENLQYFSYCAQGELRLQACCSCGLLRYPPTSACPWCASRDSEWKKTSGIGTIYSYTEVHHAIQPHFQAYVPYLVLLVELDDQKDKPAKGESLRIIGNLVDAHGKPRGLNEGDPCGIGSRVVLVFTQISESFALPQWKLLSSN